MIVVAVLAFIVVLLFVGLSFVWWAFSDDRQNDRHARARRGDHLTLLSVGAGQVSKADATRTKRLDSALRQNGPASP
jgi:hypothetical protein